MYIDYDYYKSIYGEKVDEQTFNRLVWDACKKLDNETTGIDGFVKLKRAFPTDADDAEAVKRCVCKVLNLMHDIETAESVSSGFIERADGTVVSKQIASVSSGSESITYAKTGTSTVDSVLADKDAQNRLYASTVSECLEGVADANGVYLLYMGTYPRRAYDK